MDCSEDGGPNPQQEQADPIAHSSIQNIPVTPFKNRPLEFGFVHIKIDPTTGSRKKYKEDNAGQPIGPSPVSTTSLSAPLSQLIADVVQNGDGDEGVLAFEKCVILQCFTLNFIHSFFFSRRGGRYSNGN